MKLRMWWAAVQMGWIAGKDVFRRVRKTQRDDTIGAVVNVQVLGIVDEDDEVMLDGYFAAQRALRDEWKAKRLARQAQRAALKEANNG